METKYFCLRLNLATPIQEVGKRSADSTEFNLDMKYRRPTINTGPALCTWYMVQRSGKESEQELRKLTEGSEKVYAVVFAYSRLYCSSSPKSILGCDLDH